MPGVLTMFQKLDNGFHFRHNKILKSGRLVQQIYPIFKSQLSTYGEAYQYLKKSIVPTSHFQDSLPHLPIPKLDNTCERYLRAQKPLLTAEAFKKTKLFTDEFLKSEGIQSQNLLIEEDKKNKNTSYISRPWFDMYLSDRRPLPINSNPFLVFKKETYNESYEKLYSPQLIKASNLVISSLRFYKSLQEETLKPEVFYLNPSMSDSVLLEKFTSLLPKPISWYGAYLFQAYPLDMSQFPNLFNTTRIPEEGKDRIKHVHRKKHLLVMRRGNFYVFDVIDENGNIVPPHVIVNALNYILTSNDPAAEHPVGVLTTLNRSKWASERKHLESIGNSEELELIDTSLFNLVLDDDRPGDKPEDLIRLFLHSDGSNRWFDKSLSLIITADGYAGINFEHSWGDGVAVLRYFNDIHRDSTTDPKVPLDAIKITTGPIPRKLEFKLDDRMKSSIYSAEKDYNKTCHSLEVRALEYGKFGRQICKPLNISPDAMMQLAFQMAYDKLEGKQVTTYESCSTSAFKHGRTETVRPCTIETQEVCHALRQQTLDSSRDQLQHMIKKCSEVHTRLIKEAAMGQGFDRHLFALKLKCEELGLNPDLYSDPAYKAINHNILSTSTLSSDFLLLGAFGPVVPNGYGIGYSIWKDKLGTIVTNYKGLSDGEGFIQALQDSFNQIKYILEPYTSS